MPMPPNLNKMLEQAQKMQEEMAAAQEKLKEEKVDASAGGGMVKVVATGDGRLESIHIDPDAVDPEDVELLQDMVLAAVNEALRQTDAIRERAMEGAAGFDPMEALGSLGLGGALGGGGGGAPGGLPGGAPNRAARRKKR
ncbi:MAG TPA: YbaB/EbfC family nucleoid-associated protein [Solirubrobacteraceae bacterium]|nr:YbaB/EbfC family nucleoid-associated protein [Solirubrobacteraceae bacterium]